MTSLPLRGLPRRIVVAIIGVYQKLLSPRLGANCRYRPTCSSYAAGSIARFGIWKGSWLALRRLARCHPLRPGGFDPVPDRWARRRWARR